MKKPVIVLACLVLLAAAYVGYRAVSSPSEESGMMQTATSDAGHFIVSIEPENAAFQRNVLHAWIAELKTVEGKAVTDASITIDGGMKQHGHGLPTAPEVTENLGQGRYKIDGVLFNMGGQWQFQLSIISGDISDKVTFNLVF